MNGQVITIFCAFTRRWAVERWLENLSSVAHDPALTNLAIIVDLDEPSIKIMIEKYALSKGYRSFVWKINDDHNPNEVRIAMRRQRIAEIKNQSKNLIASCDGDIVVCFEDDTVFDGLDLNRLIEPLRDETVGFVEGVQCGRWGVKMIGAWVCDDFEFPKKIETLKPHPEGGYEEIDGGGWYGYATRRDLYLNHDYSTSSSQPWGPDVNYGLWLRNRGYRCLIDWSTVFGHNDHNVVLYPDDAVTKIVYTKDTNTGKWDRNDSN